MKIISHRISLTLILLLILLPLFTYYIALGLRHGTNVWIIASDGLGYFAPLRSLMIDKDLNFENEFRDHNPLHHAVPDFTKKTKTGLVGGKYPIGQAILWVPFFMIAHGFVVLVDWFGANIPADGYSSPYQFFIGFGSVLYGLAGLFFIYQILKLYYNKIIASLSVLFVLLGTNLYYYFLFVSTMSHLSSMCVVSFFVYYFLITKGTSNLRRFTVLGLLYALMIMIRYQNGLFGAIVVLDFFERRNPIQWKSISKKLFYAMLGFIPLFMLQMICWKIVYGTYLVYSYGDEGFNFFQPHLLKVLFSSRHGLVSWTPMIALCCVGMIIAIKRARSFAVLCLLLFIMQLYVNASWHMWWFGSSYGARAFIECSFIFCLGMAAILEESWHSKWRQYSLFSIIAVMIMWNSILSLFYIIKLVPADGYFSWIALIKSGALGICRILASHL